VVHPFKGLRAAADGLYLPAPPQTMIEMFGGSAEDYLPTVEVEPAIQKEFALFADLDTQWNVSFAGPVGLKYEVVKELAELYDLPFDRLLLDDIRVMESAALQRMRTTAQERG